MAISEFNQQALRKRVGILGLIQGAARDALQRRGYACYDISLTDFPAEIELSTTEAIIVVQPPGSLLRDELVACIPALNFDCRVYVQRATDARSVTLLNRTVEKLTPTREVNVTQPAWRFDPSCFEREESSGEPLYEPAVHFITAESPAAWEALATLIGRNPAERLRSAPIEILGDDANGLSDEQRALLRRAFFDCRKVLMCKKSNGLSGIGTYEVLAWQGESLVASDWPVRFFVKLGDRSKVLVEYRKYVWNVMENVPFHLGPRLRLDRCCLGATEGLIVSDYVSDAEALRDCAREGRGTTAIANLFNRTLWAWRRGAKVEDCSLADHLLARLNRAVPAHRQPLCAQLGATCSIDQLKALFARCASTRVLLGVVHGDLHATNVLVRQSDAVLIDLEKVGGGHPLLFDAASLEGGLLIDGFIQNDSRPVSEILASIRTLYEREAFRSDDHFCEPPSPSQWYFDSVRQIRMQARQLERGGAEDLQYAWTLAAVLVQKSTNPYDFNFLEDGSPAPDGRRREEVRAMAYVVAEIILKQLGASGDEPGSRET